MQEKSTQPDASNTHEDENRANANDQSKQDIVILMTKGLYNKEITEDSFSSVNSIMIRLAKTSDANRKFVPPQGLPST